MGRRRRQSLVVGGALATSLVSGTAAIAATGPGAGSNLAAHQYGGIGVEVTSTGGGAAVGTAATTIETPETLADAITYLNAHGGGSIGFASTLSGATVELTAQLPEITQPTTIYGIGSSETTIDGGGAAEHLGSILRIGASAGLVGIYDIALSNGYTTGDGGAIDAAGRVNLGNVDLRGNVAVGPGSRGGAIYGSDVEVVRGTISGNRATRAGGGIFSGDGGIHLEQATISGNRAADGAGIATTGSRYLALDSSTISGNHASHDFGGVYAEGAPAGTAGNSRFTIVSSTIAENTAAGTGGGLVAKSHPMLLVQDTITRNRARSDGGVGFAANSPASPNRYGSLTLQDTILAANSARYHPDLEVHAGAHASARFSLLGDAEGTRITRRGANIVGTGRHRAKPMLGPLRNNGGTTRTMMPLRSSRAIDAGFSFNEAFDQRGDARTVSLGRRRPRGGDGTDIGSVEVQLGDLPARYVRARAGDRRLSLRLPPSWVCAAPRGSYPMRFDSVVVPRSTGQALAFVSVRFTLAGARALSASTDPASVALPYRGLKRGRHRLAAAVTYTTTRGATVRRTLRATFRTC